MSREDKCFSGHNRKDHGKYIGKGRSGKGSRYVCNVDNCHRWQWCDLKEEKVVHKRTIHEGFCEYYTYCKKWISWKNASWFWKHVTCRKCLAKRKK